MVTSCDQVVYNQSKASVLAQKVKYIYIVKSHSKKKQDSKELGDLKKTSLEDLPKLLGWCPSSPNPPAGTVCHIWSIHRGPQHYSDCQSHMSNAVGLVSRIHVWWILNVNVVFRMELESKAVASDWLFQSIQFKLLVYWHHITDFMQKMSFFSCILKWLIPPEK